MGGVGEVTPPLTLLSCLRYVGILLGGGGNCPQKLWYVNTKNYLAKQADRGFASLYSHSQVGVVDRDCT